MSKLTQTAYATRFTHLADLKNWIGKELGLTEWLTITQDRINAFADATEDHQWIHTDPEKSRQFSPYKTTVAHGFLVLSLASKFAYEAYAIDDVVMGVNYGLNKVRFPNATLVGAQIRARVSLLDFEEQPKAARYVLGVVFELKGEAKPACVAEFVAMAYVG